MARGIYSTFEPEKMDDWLTEEVLPIITRTLEATEPLKYAANLIEVLGTIYQAASESLEEHLFVIITDASGNQKEILRLLSFIPSNVGMQIVVINATGVRNIAGLQSLVSSQLTFMVMASDDATEREAQQIIVNRFRGDDSRN